MTKLLPSTPGKFQFHKVRLKALQDLNKRLQIMFQFHKVRLKVPALQSIFPTKLFQFHKVRLKERKRLSVPADL